MTVHAPGFMVAEQYRSRLVAAGLIEAEPQQPLFSDSPRDSGTSDAGAEVLSASAIPGGGSRPPSADAPIGDQAPPPAQSAAASHSTNESAPASCAATRGTT